MEISRIISKNLLESHVNLALLRHCTVFTWDNIELNNLHFRTSWNFQFGNIKPNLYKRYLPNSLSLMSHSDFKMLTTKNKYFFRSLVSGKFIKVQNKTKNVWIFKER